MRVTIYNTAYGVEKDILSWRGSRNWTLAELVAAPLHCSRPVLLLPWTPISYPSRLIFAASDIYSDPVWRAAGTCQCFSSRWERPATEKATRLNALPTSAYYTTNQNGPLTPVNPGRAAILPYTYTMIQGVGDGDGDGDGDGIGWWMVGPPCLRRSTRQLIPHDVRRCKLQRP